MSERNSQPIPDVLDQATRELRDTPVPAGPPASLTAATIAAVANRIAGTVPSELARRQKWRRTMRYVGFGTAAAVILATAAGVLWLGGNSAEARVQKALDNAAKAKSVRLVNTLDRDGKLEKIMTLYVQTDRSRWEINCSYPEQNATIVIDTKARQALKLNHKEKTAHRETLAGEQLADMVKQHEVFFNPLGVVREIKDMTVKELDGEKINGRPMKVFMLSHPGNEEHAQMTAFLWIDEKTNLPARLKFIQYQQSIPGHQEGADMITDFEDWNKDFDAKLFEQKVPAGYEIVDKPEALPAPFAPLLRAMAKAAKAETVRFTWTQTSGPPGLKGKSFKTDKNGNVREYDSSSESVMKVTAKGAKVRIEYGETSVRQEDYTTDKVLTLDHKYKVATRFTTGGKEGDWFGLFNRLAKLKPENVKPVGEEMIGTVKALKYELEKSEKSGVIASDVWEGAKWTAWIDPKTDLPVRLRYMKDENLKWEFTGFVWNEPAEDALFEQKVPKDYTVEEWGNGDAKKD